MKTLVIEDAPEVVDSIILCLTVRWPDIVLIATDSGGDAVQFARSLSPDVVLLDLALPDVYGMQVLREIRNFSNAPVIIVTANKEETSRVMGFDLGSDDYLIKPFSHIELLGSIKAALSRTRQDERPPDESPVKSWGLVIDLTGHRVVQSGSEIRLTPTEWGVLTALIRNQGQIVPRAGLISDGWGARKATPAALNLCIRHLRMKLGDNPRRPRLIRLHQDEGYSLDLFQ